MPLQPVIPTERGAREAVDAVVVRSRTEPHIQRFDSFEHVQLGDTAGGPSSGFILLESYNRDLPQHAGPVTGWPAEWQRYFSTSRK
jgi:hypothetical protein